MLDALTTKLMAGYTRWQTQPLHKACILQNIMFCEINAYM